MDSSAIRSRLADSGGRLYWRSLGELADTPAFREYLHREFPEQASEWNDPKGRRQFLKLMSASLALAGVSACTKQPPESIVPYVRQPEDLVPGRPLFFATRDPVLRRRAAGPGREPHGASDQDRGQSRASGEPRRDRHHHSGRRSWALRPRPRADALYRSQMRAWATSGRPCDRAWPSRKPPAGAGLRILSGPITSPSLAELMATVLEAYPQAQWHQYDPMSRDGARAAAQQAAGRPSEAIYHFDKADVVLSLDADFLACGPGSVRYTRDFADRRRVADEHRRR